MERSGKGIRSLLLLALLSLGMGAWADNVVTISTTEGAPGDEVMVSVSLTNTDAVSSLQVSIPLDENLTLVDGSGQKGTRCSSHSLTVGVKDGVLNVLVYSLSMAAITGNSGEVASFRLKLGNNPTTVALTPSKTVLTSSSGMPVEASAVGGEVTIRCAKAQYSTMEVDFGAVPICSTYQETVTVTNVGNDDLTLTDLVFSDINVFSSTTSLPLTLEPGASQDLNITYAPVERGSISKTLKVECNSISKLNTIRLKAQPFAVNELHIQDASGISDEEVTVTMSMNNMDAVSGYQVEFNLPEQLQYVENSFALSDRKQDHTAIASVNGTTLRIIVYSPNDKPLTGNDGVIGTFRVKLVGRYGTELSPTRTVLSATINNSVENVVSAVYGGYIDIQSPTISTDDVLDFGAVPVTEACEQTFTISNFGSAPLTVSRILFNNENLSVSETLPLVVPSGDNRDITVVYGSVEQTAFEATMQIYSNDPDLRLREVMVRGSRFAPNYISISTNDVSAGDNLKVEVSVDNYDPMTGLQFDLTYPGQYFESFDNNVTLTARATGMTVIARQIDANTLRYFCYFLSGGSVAAGSGEVMTIQLKPKNNVIGGSYSVSLSNITFGTTDMANKYAGDETLQSMFEAEDFLLGDVNYNGEIDIGDAVCIVNYLVNKQNTTFNAAAADLNGNNQIDIGDAVMIVNILVGKDNDTAAPVMDIEETTNERNPD